MSCKKCKANKCSCITNICINPLIYLFKHVFALIDNTPLSLVNTLTDTLQNGLSISNNEKFCCPDCKDGVYFVGNSTQFALLYTKLTQPNFKLCCQEHLAPAENWNFFQNIKGFDLDCCETDFNQAIQLWLNASALTNSITDLNTIIANGIYESSSFNEYSGMGILFNYLQLNNPELTEDDYLNILNIITTIGIVIECDDCRILIISQSVY